MLESCHVKFIPKLSCFLLAAILPNKIHLQDRSERQSMAHFRGRKNKNYRLYTNSSFLVVLPSLTAEVTLLDRCTLPQNATFKISSKRHKSLDKAHSPWWLSFPAHLSETLLLITAQPLQKFILAGIWLLCETKHLPLSETVIASIFSWWIPFQYLGLLWTSVFQMGFFTLIKYGT